MCLGVPGKVITVKDDWIAEVDISGVVIDVGLQFTPEAKVGDYVLVHTGYAMHVMDEAEAMETLKLLEEMGAAAELPDGQIS